MGDIHVHTGKRLSWGDILVIATQCSGKFIMYTRSLATSGVRQLPGRLHWQRFCRRTFSSISQYNNSRCKEILYSTMVTAHSQDQRSYYAFAWHFCYQKQCNCQFLVPVLRHHQTAHLPPACTYYEAHNTQ